MSDAARTTSVPESKAQSFRGWEFSAREATPAGTRQPDGCDDHDELAAVAVLSTN